MNEKIKLLAEQAWDATAVSPDFGHPVSFAEKFAELIVRECVDICDEVQSQYGQYTFTATTVKNRVRERFGVEE